MTERRRREYFEAGYGFLTKMETGQWDGTKKGDVIVNLGEEGDVPVVGDWDGAGTSKVGIFRKGLWVLDFDGDGSWRGEGPDRKYRFGSGCDTPVLGDWNGNGRTSVGCFSAGVWQLDMDGNGVWDVNAGDLKIQMGRPGDQPVVLP